MNLTTILNAIFSRTPKAAIVSLSLALLCVIGYIDKVTDVDIGMSVFYVIPIALCAWYVNLGWGLLLSMLSTGTLIYADVVDGHPWSTPAAPYWNAIVHMGFFIIIVVTLDKLKSSYAREQLLSRIDPLTGAANKRYFDEILASEVERVRRYRHPVTLAYLDADNFKAVNDRLGHDAGDALLKAVVRTMRGDLREFDALARLGGDEFAVLLPETPEDMAVPIFERIRDKLRTVMAANDWPVTFSIGLVTFVDPPAKNADLVTCADALMYRAKQQGKDAICHESRRAPEGEPRTP